MAKSKPSVSKIGNTTTMKYKGGTTVKIIVQIICNDNEGVETKFDATKGDIFQYRLLKIFTV